MGKDKNQERRPLAGFGEVGNCLDIGRKLDSRKVFYVLVCFVDNFGKFSGMAILWMDPDHFFKDPHVDLGLIKWKALAISSNNRRNCGTPISAADDADSVEPTVRMLGIDHCIRSNLLNLLLLRSSCMASSRGLCLRGFGSKTLFEVNCL